MMIQLQTYFTEIMYLKGKEMHLGDALSRTYLPLKDNINNTKEPSLRKSTCATIVQLRLRLRQIRRATEEDESLQSLRCVILTGWPYSKDYIPAQVIPYFHFRNEPSVQGGLIFKGERVLISFTSEMNCLFKVV